MKYLSLHDAQIESKKYNFYSPNIKYCHIDENSNSIQFVCIRYIGFDSVRSDVIFLLDTKLPFIISPYEKQYIRIIK